MNAVIVLQDRTQHGSQTITNREFECAVDGHHVLQIVSPDSDQAQRAAVKLS